MSRKRFGRSRRRKLEANARMSNHTARAANERAAQAERELSRVLSVINSVCPNSVALPPKQAPRSIIDQLEERGYAQVNARSLSLAGCSEGYLGMAVKSTVTEVHQLKVYLEDNFESMQTAIHFKCGSAHYRHIISQQALEHMPVKHLSDLIAEEVLMHVGNRETKLDGE